jgi:hypothetical protein
MVVIELIKLCKQNPTRQLFRQLFNKHINRKKLKSIKNGYDIDI